jgi:hypothetical protein
MRKLLLVLSFCVCGQIAFGEEVLKEINWTQLKQAGHLLNGAIIPADSHTPFEQLQIASSASQPTTVEVLGIEKPRFTSVRYAITGKVRYENVEGEGYLEAWSYSADGRFESSRTVAKSGPMQSLQGDSDWRAFSLPFSIGKSQLRPERLIVKVVLPGAGTVQLGQVRLVQYADNRWKSLFEQGVWPLAVGAAVLVICYCVLGFLASRGRARHLVTGTFIAFLFLGAIAFVLGVVALGRSGSPMQPLQFFLLAAILLVPSAVALSCIGRRYEQRELRRMDAMDAASQG